MLHLNATAFQSIVKCLCCSKAMSGIIIHYHHTGCMYIAIHVAYNPDDMFMYIKIPSLSWYVAVCRQRTSKCHIIIYIACRQVNNPFCIGVSADPAVPAVYITMEYNTTNNQLVTPGCSGPILPGESILNG